MNTGFENLPLNATKAIEPRLVTAAIMSQPKRG